MRQAAAGNAEPSRLRGVTSSREISRSRSRSTRRITSSLIVPVAPQVDEGLPLGREELEPQPLVALRAKLDLAVVGLVEAGGEAPHPEPVRAAHPLGRVVVDPVLAGELLEPGERRLRRLDPRLGLFLLVEPVGLEPEQADHGRQRETLEDEGRDDHREREVDHEVPVGERRAAVRDGGNRRARPRARRLRAGPSTRSPPGTATAETGRARGAPRQPARNVGGRGTPRRSAPRSR